MRILAAALVILTSAATAEAQRQPTVAVLGLEVVDGGSGIDAETVKVADNITDALRKLPARAGGSYRLARNSARTLQEMKVLSGCADEGTECMRGIAKSLGADALLYGKVQRYANGFVIALSLLDARTGKRQGDTAKLGSEAARSAKRIAAKSSALYSRLTGVPETGAIEIRSAQAKTGTVYIDGKAAATLKDGEARLPGLSAASHKVAIESPGYQRYEVDMVVRAGETVQIEPTLLAASKALLPEPSDPPSTGSSRIGYKIGFGVAVAFTLLSGGVYVTSFGAVSEAEDRALLLVEQLTPAEQAMLTDQTDVCADSNRLQGRAFDDIRRACNDGENAETRNSIAFAATAVGLAATGTLLYLAFLRGDPGPSEVAGIAPLVGPGTAGAQVTWHF